MPGPTRGADDVTDELTAWLASLLAFGLAGAIVLVLRPRSRAIQGSPTSPGPVVRRLAAPPLGGISIFLAVVVASLAFVPLDDAYRGILVGTAAIAVAGIVADVRGLPTLVMFLAQIGAAGIAVAHGVGIERFTFPFIGIVAELPSWADTPLTIAWIVVLMRLVDFVDGLDGLAAGMVAIAATTFFVYLVRGGEISESASVAALLSVITVGICVGFLPWNFHPARIFMGDTGSMLLGMLVAIATIAGVGSDLGPPERGEVAVIALPLLVPLLVLAIPFLDVLLAIVRRTRKGIGIAHADKEHIFHRLMDIGHGHRQTVLLMYLWSALVCGSALAIGVIDGRLVAGVVVGCALVLFLVTALPRLLERRRNGEPNGRHAATHHARPAEAERPSVPPATDPAPADPTPSQSGP